ncbi:MAG: FtsX-like permease family protein, partial [Bacteroidota bacterium]
LGLLGLVAFTVEKRQKEIGIRKVLGSSVAALVLLLSSSFAKMILIAILISVPISYWFLDNWLASFVYRVELEPWFFILAGLLSLLIAAVSMGFQTVKAAIANPIDALRNE